MWYDTTTKKNNNKDLDIIKIFVFFYQYNNENKLVDDYDDQPANFGPQFPTGGLKVIIISYLIF